MGMKSMAMRALSVFTMPAPPEEFLRLVNPLASSRQLRGVVTSVTPETSHSATITFRPGSAWQPHQAGQWARVGVEIDGTRQWRSYSLSAPAGADPAITVTAIGRVSTYLVRETRVGDILFLAPPQGDFILPAGPRPLLMLTAGSGITPVMSMVRTLVPRRSDADLVLIHSARDRSRTLFGEELAELEREHPGLHVVHRYTSEDGRIRFDGAGDLDRLCSDWRSRKTYVCGPEEMLIAAQALWEREGVPDALTVERFSTALAPEVPGGGGLVTFEKSDKQVEVDGSTPLLVAGEDAGVMMPSGCRMGICHTCLTPLLSGRVRDLRTGEVCGEEGDLIQTCISAPAGPVSIDR